MPSIDLAPHRPTPEVLALGEPERIFADPRWLANACRAVCALFGATLALGAAALAVYFWLLGPDELRGKVPHVAIALASGALGVGGVALVLAGWLTGHPSVYLIFAGALAMKRRGTWQVVPWCEVKAVHPLTLRAFPHLELRDGTKVPLGANGSFFADELFREVRRAVESPLLFAPCGRPPVNVAEPLPVPPPEGGKSAGEDSPWGLLIAGALLMLGAAWFYLHLQQLEAEGGDMRIHWMIAVAYNLGGKLAAAGLLGAVGLGLLIGGLNGLINGSGAAARGRPEGPDGLTAPRHLVR